MPVYPKNKLKFLALGLLFMCASYNSQAQVYEVYDDQLQLIQKINNDHIFLLSNVIRVSDKDGQIKLLNYRYEPFLNIDGEKIFQYLSPWIIIQKNGKFGAYHEYGEKILDPEYDEIEPYFNQILARKGNEYFHYDRGNREVKHLGNFQKAWIASNGQVIGKIPSGYLLPLSPRPDHVFEKISSPSPNTLLTQEASGYGLVNRQGEYILEPIIDTIAHLEGDQFYAFNQKQHMLLKAQEADVDISYSSYHKITADGNVILEYIHGKLRRIMKNGGILLDIQGMESVTEAGQNHYNVLFKNKKLGLLDEKGIWRVVPTENITQLFPGRQGLYGALIDRKYGFVDQSGKLRISNRFEMVGQFSEGFASIQSGGKWGFINQNDEITIEPQFDQVGDFHRGLALVKKNGKDNLIDTQGNLMLSKYYDQISLIADHYYITESKGQYGLINPLGKEIATPKFDDIRREAYDRIIVKRNGKYGLMNEKGNYILPIYYQDILLDQGTQKILAEDIYIPPVLVEDGKKKRKKQKGA
ncbi:WG repeat-containing protein [Echinicola jeungdonensis]|uniref:WG repeat-containing protein n=1 Tax=Echinicola jeungdonensis TaxID=709343 RepID=A0ABV5J0W3_9BACT|nr:WG repeat-containing protein [Echinicola jeungdonensis]MDN3668295.1 WG repeat-containing protein [Echinicola jeungdonensis]